MEGTQFFYRIRNWLTAEDGQIVIEDKTVSRKHLTIAVDPATPGDCVRFNTAQIAVKAYTCDRQTQEHDLVSFCATSAQR
jgi:hypothetical protein